MAGSVSVQSMKALEFRRKEARFAAAMLASRLRAGAGAEVGPLALADIDPPEAPDQGWTGVRTRLAGICGSDLDTVDGRASRYFEPIVSFPFVPGHEVLGTLQNGQRVVVEPVLGAEARGEVPPFPGAAPGDGNDYGHLIGGHIRPGLQIGYCQDTGGGWSEQFVAHASQIHDVPDDLTDDDAVVVEPTACGVHVALRAGLGPAATVAVIGAGTMGLVTLAALRRFHPDAWIIVAAKHPHQRELASELGADAVVAPEELSRAVRRQLGCRVIGEALSSGVDATVDAVGSESSLVSAINVTRPRGRVVMLGMPGSVRLDLTPLWHRETELLGAYTYGTETLPDGATARGFDLAIELAGDAGLGRLVSARYPLEDYREAIAHAAEAGSRGAVKVVFDLTH